MKQESSTKEVGKKGEEIALNFLQKKGYELLERNYRAGRAEIDLIMKDKQTVVAVEVKTRYNALYEPERAVSKNQQKTLAMGIEVFLKNNKLVLPARFDIVTIHYQQNKMEIAHFEDAFYPGY
ncbi:MAG: YraN family protein [Bacteroidetes bacterium]|nr:YraN family protein [Bacteroidota bacterium]